MMAKVVFLLLATAIGLGVIVARPYVVPGAGGSLAPPPAPPPVAAPRDPVAPPPDVAMPRETAARKGAAAFAVAPPEPMPAPPAPAPVPEKATAPASADRPPLDRQELVELQRALAVRGYNPGPIDGLWGPRTARAIADFRRATGLDPRAPVDADTVLAATAATEAAATAP